VAIANLIGVLRGAGAVAFFVIAALYLQRVLGYDPLRVELAFFPATATMAWFSAGLSARRARPPGGQRLCVQQDIMRLSW